MLSVGRLLLCLVCLLDIWKPLVLGEGEAGIKEVPKPCCFPYSFQATVADMKSVSTGNIRLLEVYRDWERRLQVQRIMAFAPPGQVTPTATMILDFQHSVQYMVTSSGDCQSQPLTYAMLEPCMPEDAVYLGETYLGFGQDKTQFRTWTFRREDEGRNVTMTVAATKHDCVPVMETITGTLGGGRVDTIVTFTTFGEVQDLSIFNIPNNCVALT